MTLTAEQAAARIKQALRTIDDSGQSHGGPDGWSTTSEEIGEWQDYFRECASPEALKLLLAERDEMANDAARYRWLMSQVGAVKLTWTTSTDCGEPAPEKMFSGIITITNDYSGHEMQSIIDAAIAASPSSAGGA